MLLPRFEYRTAGTLREATSLWAEAPGARYLAGGTDLLPQMRSRRKVSRVVDVKKIAELGQIRDLAGGGLAIGSCVPMSAIAAHPGVRKNFPVLVRCIEEVGAWPLRNRATLGGNVCNASPAADTAPALLALEAEVVVAGPAGQRTIKIGDFFRGPGKTALADGELLLEVVLPAAAAGFEGRYLRLARRRGMDLATVGVLVARRGEGAGAHRLALAAVAPTPVRVKVAEELLDGQGLGAESIQRAAAIAVDCCSPITDIRGSAEYRREMVGVLAARGLEALA